eukprot:426051-Prymnesium_polylepis.2
MSNQHYTSQAQSAVRWVGAPPMSVCPLRLIPDCSSSLTIRGGGKEGRQFDPSTVPQPRLGRLWEASAKIAETARNITFGCWRENRKDGKLRS